MQFEKRFVLQLQFADSLIHGGGFGVLLCFHYRHEINHFIAERILFKLFITCARTEFSHNLHTRLFVRFHAQHYYTNLFSELQFSTRARIAQLRLIEILCSNTMITAN